MGSLNNAPVGRGVSESGVQFRALRSEAPETKELEEHGDAWHFPDRQLPVPSPLLEGVAVCLGGWCPVFVKLGVRISGHRERDSSNAQALALAHPGKVTEVLTFGNVAWQHAAVSGHCPLASHQCHQRLSSRQKQPESMARTRVREVTRETFPKRGLVGLRGPGLAHLKET